MHAPHFDLLIIGDEILSGRREDKHFVFARNLFATHGLSLSSVRMVADDRAQITASLRFSRAHNWHVISCGGIGATPDDHTRQAAALAFDRPLQPHLEAQALIRARIQQTETAPVDFSQADFQRRLEMGVFPAEAHCIPNPYNGIAGFSLDNHYFLPGFPVMAGPMMEWVLQTYYSDYFAPTVSALALIVHDVAESRLTPIMLDLEARFPAIKVFSLPAVANSRPQFPKRHVELGVKLAPNAQYRADSNATEQDPATQLKQAFAQMQVALVQQQFNFEALQ